MNAVVVTHGCLNEAESTGMEHCMGRVSDHIKLPDL